MTQEHVSKPRVILPDLKELGRRLEKVDQHIVALLSKRMALAIQVQEWKKDNNQPIIRFEVEEKRLANVKDWAEERGMDPNFARATFYLIIAESCRVQINHLQKETDELEKFRKANQEDRDRILRENLLRLTAAIAPTYDEVYGVSADPATASYIKFENEAINREIGTLSSLGNLGMALDLGCATGRMTFAIAPHFEKTIGYDISPQMIGEAYKKKSAGSNVEFREIDLEKGIPIENETVSLIVMNLGTASDVSDFRRIAVAVKRVLKKDGRFVFSFYNSAALLYQWFVPWPPSLTAEINLDTHCLDVRFKDKVFRVHARPYSVREVKKILMDLELAVGSIKTYPTLVPVLTSEFFEEEDEQKTTEVRKTAEEIDIKLADLDRGAYILVTGRKT